jgi:hypothetical protein
MAQEQDDRNDKLMQRRKPDPQETGSATSGRLPFPNEIIGKKEPPFDVTGADAISPLLMHVDFPATKEEIASRIGHARVPVDRKRTETVREVLDRVAPETFRSSREVEDAINRIYERSGTQKGDDLGGRKPN